MTTPPVKTLCPYCGVGCGLEVLPSVGETGQVRGDRTHPSSLGKVCVKGATVTQALNRDRLLYPLRRSSLQDPFTPVTWDQALEEITNRIQALQATPESICMYGSGQLQTEDYYVAQKLLKGCLGTNNFDSNSRLCMSSAVAAYQQSFGADGPPCCYEDLELTDYAFLIGTNTAECHPIIFNRLRLHHKHHPGTRLVVVDPRTTPTASAADLHLAIKPGTDIHLLHGLGRLLLDQGGANQEFIARHTQGFEDYLKVLSHYPPDRVAATCGITIADLKQVAHWWQTSKRVLSLWSMGLNQSAEGTAKARALINLHLLTGQIGKPGAGPFSLTGQPNAMGGRETGGLSHLLPGYRSVTNPQHRHELEVAWGLTRGQISPRPGRDAWEIITGLETGAVGLLWIVATNPLVSLPDLERVKAALAQSPFTIYQEAYHPTETAAFAHLLLPAAQWGEKTGTMTNSERRVTLCPQFRSPPGQAQADWRIFAQVAHRLGFGAQFPYQESSQVFEEFAALTAGRPCDLSGLSHRRLSEQGPCQWPCPPGHPGTPRLYQDLNFPSGRARFSATHSHGLAEPPDSTYPWVLTSGRLYGHWHTQTRTGRIEKLRQMHPEPFLEIHPRDAAKLGIETGDAVQVRSRRGQAQLPVRITAAITPGTLFVPMHWGALWADQAAVNTLTHPLACPDSHQPELKACAVQIFPL